MLPGHLRGAGRAGGRANSAVRGGRVDGPLGAWSRSELVYVMSQELVLFMQEQILLQREVEIVVMRVQID